MTSGAPAASVADRLLAWERLHPHLSVGLSAAMDDLRGYFRSPAPRVSVLAPQAGVLAEWTQDAEGRFPADWEVREAILPVDPPGATTERFADLCRDAVVLVVPVLRMDSPGVRALADHLRAVGPPVQLVLVRFHQIARGEAVVERKRQEAARRLGFARVRVFACADDPAPGLVPLAEAAVQIRRAIEQDFPQGRPCRLAALAAVLDARARAEILALHDALRDELKHLRAETAVARRTARGQAVLAKTLGEAFHRRTSAFLESLSTVTWQDIRHPLEPAGSTPGSKPAAAEAWASALREALSTQVVELWRQLDVTHPLEIGERLEELIERARAAFLDNVAALAREPLGLTADELAPLRAAVEDEEPFRALRERCRTLTQRWQPLTGPEIDRIVAQECRGLDVTLADHLGRALRSLLPDAWKEPAARGPLTDDPPADGPPYPRSGTGPAASLEAPSATAGKAALRHWVQDRTAGALRSSVAAAIVGSALAKLNELVSRRMEEQRKALVDDELTKALDRYLDGCLAAYQGVERGFRDRMDALAALVERR